MNLDEIQFYYALIGHLNCLVITCIEKRIFYNFALDIGLLSSFFTI